MKYTKPTFVPPASRPTPYPTQPAGTAVAKFTLALALGLIPALAGHAQDAAPPGSTASATAPQSVAKTVVTGVAGPDTAPSADLTKITLDAVPGNVNVISSDQVEKSADNSISDIFNFQPGVYAQTAQGSDGIKISIRGSGINRGTGFFRTGVAFYFDGLPITGAGGTPYELFEPLGLNSTWVGPSTS